MPKRSSTEDANEIAFRVVRESLGEKPNPKKRKNPAAVALGRKGGLKGGKARAAKLTPEERSRIAREAAQKRWADRDEKNPE
jgi:hypothetical protein